MQTERSWRESSQTSQMRLWRRCLPHMLSMVRLNSSAHPWPPEMSIEWYLRSLEPEPTGLKSRTPIRLWNPVSPDGWQLYIATSAQEMPT